MKPGPRRSVSQSDIVEAAFEILEEKGVAAVSVRGVAGALGLTPTAMYTYFASKNALLQAMVEHLLAGVADATEPDWRDRVVSITLALRAKLAEHSGAMVLVTSGPLDGPNALSLAERLIESFVEAGLAVDDAARAAHVVRAFVVGQSALEAARRAAPVEASAPQPLWSDSKHPLVEQTEHLALDGGDDAEFAAALARVIDGFVAP